MTTAATQARDLSDDDDEASVQEPPAKTMRMDKEVSSDNSPKKWVKLMPASEDPNVKVYIEVPQHIAAMNVLIADMLVHEDEEEEAEDAPMQEIPLPNVSASILKAVIEFCKHHVDDPLEPIPKPMEHGKTIKDYVPTWDLNFVEAMDDVTLFKMLMASDYLTNAQLLMLTCARLGTIVKTLDNDQMKLRFNVQTNPTDEERARIVAMYTWVTDKD